MASKTYVCAQISAPSEMRAKKIKETTEMINQLTFASSTFGTKSPVNEDLFLLGLIQSFIQCVQGMNEIGGKGHSSKFSDGITMGQTIRSGVVDLNFILLHRLS